MAAPTELSRLSEASFLRRLLEPQAPCLLRVRLDGVVLACNNAALDLLGAGEQPSVVNSNLLDRLVPAERSQWPEFVARCSANREASVEWHLVTRDNNPRPVLLQAVPLTDDPDGVESLLLHLRDQSPTQQLDAATESAPIDPFENEERRRAGDQIDAAIADRLKTAVRAGEDQAECRRLVDAFEAQTANRRSREARVIELEKKLQQSRLVLLQREREYGRDVAMLKSTLAAAHAARAGAVAVAGDEKQEREALTLRLQAATAEQERLQALVAEHQGARERIAADRETAVNTLQQSLARAREDAALDIEQWRQALAESRLELAQALAEQTRIAAAVEEQSRERDLLRAQHQSALRDIEASTHAEVAGLVAQLAEASADHARLAAGLEAADRELHSQRAEHESAHEALLADHQRALADVETGRRDELEPLEARLQAATAEHRRLQALVEQDAVDRDRIAADHRAAVDTLQQSLARAQEDAALQVEQAHQALAESRSALAQSLAEHSGIASRLEEHTREQDLIRAEHHRTLADVETSKGEALELRSQLSQTLDDNRRLAALLEEQGAERDRLIADHHRVLADMETGTREAVTALRSQLSQALVDQRCLASRADEQALELNRLRIEHQAALTGTETRHRDALAGLQREFAHTAARAEQHQNECDRISAEHALSIAHLQAGNEAAAAELRSNLSDAVAAQHRLTALLEEHDGERERLVAEHRRVIADLQASKQEAVAECERVMTEVQQALLVNDTSRRVEVERRLIDGINEAPQMKVDGQRLVALQSGLTLAVSQLQVVFKDGSAPNPPDEAEHERAGDNDLLHEPFDDADDAFIHQLLGGIRANRVPETRSDPETGGPAPAVSEVPELKTDDKPADDMFDANDATFVRRLMDTPEPPPQPSAADDS